MKSIYFNDYVKQYLTQKEDQLSIMSYNHYSLMIHKHILPYFKDMTLSKINKEVIRDFLASLHLEDSSKNMIKSILRSIFEVIQEETDSEYSSIIPLLVQNVSTKEKRVLSKEEEELLKDYCLSHLDEYTLSILLALYCGLKIAELCALQVKDFIIEDHTFHIIHQLQRISDNSSQKNKTQMWLGKLEKPSNRIIPVPDFLYDLLIEYNQDMDTFLLSKKQEYKGARIYQLNIKKLSSQLGFEMNYQLLRDTFKENCLDANMNIYEIMRILGLHSITVNAKE